MSISNESRDFLDNLRLYLISSGKKEEDIEEIIEELHDHLVEAEKNGKSVQAIIGQSPKEYMEQLAGEMPLDVKGLLKYIPIVLLGAFSYIWLGDAIRGNLDYTLLEAIGYPVVFLIAIVVTAAVFKYSASRSLSRLKQWCLFTLVGILPVALIVALFFLNAHYETPTMQAGTVGTVLAIAIPIAVFIGMAVWSKTWFSIIVPLILFIPQILIQATGLREDMKLILSSLIPIACLLIYNLIVIKRAKSK